MGCLIPCAIDQDPYFRMTRDVAPKLKEIKPALIHSKFIPSLKGPGGKMSASDENTSIYVTDTDNQIKKKINRYAFSGGGETVEEQRAKGANLEVDIPYQYLKFFLESDDQLKDIGEKYSKGGLLTGEVKQELIKVLQEVIKNHREKRALVTDEVVEEYMKVRPLD